MSFNQISFGEPKRNESPSVSVRPPTEGGQASFQEVATSSEVSLVSHTMNMPSTASGDLLIAAVGTNGSRITKPASWTELASQKFAINAWSEIWYKIADGTETSETLSMSGTSGEFVSAVWNIRAPGIDFSTTIPEISKNYATNATVDFPSHTPTTAPGDYLIFAIHTHRSAGGSYGTPTGYTQFVDIDRGSSDPGFGIARLLIEGMTTEDPPSVTEDSSASPEYTAYVVSVLATGSADVAPGNHVHEGDTIDSTGVTDGYVLTADGADGAAWEAPTGGDHGALTGLADDDHTQYTHIYGGRVPFSNHGNTGATETVDFSAAALHRLTLDANCTITLTGPVGTRNGGTVAEDVVIELDQDATGSRTVTWPGSVTWVGGSAPTLSTDANARDVIVLYTVDGGTNYLGVHVGAGGASAFDDLTDVTLTGFADGQGVFYRDSSSLWENARAPEPLTDETPAILFLEDDTVAMSEPFFD